MRKIDLMMAAKGLLPATQMAARVGVSVFTIYRWVNEEKVKGMKMQGHWYVDRNSMIEYLGLEAANMLGLLGNQPGAKLANTEGVGNAVDNKQCADKG
jgi:hypothetical protein